MRVYSLSALLVSIWFLILCSLCFGELKSLRRTFNVSGTVVDTRCSDAKLADIDVWWRESYELVTRALAALQNARDTSVRYDAQLRRYLAAFYDVPFSRSGRPQGDVVPKIETQFRTVVEFMQGYRRRGLQGEQYLYCDGQWLYETEDAFSGTGEPRLYGNGTQMTIRDDPMMRLEFPYIRAEFADGGWVDYLYWAPDFRQYRTIRDGTRRFLPDERGVRHICNGRSGVRYRTLAMVSDFPAGSVLTLCPAHWNVDFGGGGNTVAEALALARNHPPGQNIDAVLPKTAGVLHELFHFALGVRETPDNGYRFPSVVRNRAYQPWSKPETNVYFAWALYLSTMLEPRLDWTTGVSEAPQPGCWPRCFGRG